MVDDGSTDATAEIVESYTDNRIRLIRQANQGVSVARNTALEEANGQYITFLDSDDLYYPDCLKTLLHLIQSNKTEMSFGNFSESYNVEDMKKTDIKNIRNLIKDKLFGVRILTDHSLIDVFPTNVDCVMISKKLIEQYNLRFLQGVRMFEDGNFLFKAFIAAKKASGVYRCLSHYRRHSDSSSFIQYSSREEATPLDLRANELEFAQRYGLNGEFIKRTKRFEIFKKFKSLVKQGERTEAAQFAAEHKEELLQYAETAEHFNNRWGCRILLFWVAGI